MFNFTIVVFDGTSPTFYFTNTSGWNTSSSKEILLFDPLAVPKFSWKSKVAMFHLRNRLVCCLGMKYENPNGFIQGRGELLPITRVGGRRIATPTFATVLHFRIMTQRPTYKTSFLPSSTQTAEASTTM